MASADFPLDRRRLIAGIGAAALIPALPSVAVAQARAALALQAKADQISLRPGEAETPVWSIGGPELRFKRGDLLDVNFTNGQPGPVALNWRGIDGAAAVEPLASRAPLAPGSSETFPLQFRHAGTFLCEAGLLGDGGIRPARSRAIVVTESTPISVDRDELLLIEEWWLKPDGKALASGLSPENAKVFHSINGKPSFDISARANDRLRLRFINAGQRTVMAVKIENLEVRVMGVDGQPAEPFPARNGALVLAPGGRTDAFVDVVGAAGTSFAVLLHDGKEARPAGKVSISKEAPVRPAPLPPAPPLPSNGLPTNIDLKNAARVDLPLGNSADWLKPIDFKPSSAPAFKVKPGRPVVLALANRGPLTNVFHLHGHHFRLLDRLDDGWKPFWLDTLALAPGETQRIAFLAEHPGRYLIESVATDWAAPRLLRWYSVE
ncbi:multicopper oxidase family protein [Bradyrhizobium jicamae]|uniref:multicopper oxidase family protein n=1 Tax=Bradyrhizobium jicamae TaxID=280332 RepID=UPI002011A4B1|nr:multicopper oxidase domain-containing protein [Bradyrhizobium jicamae]